MGGGYYERDYDLPSNNIVNQNTGGSQASTYEYSTIAAQKVGLIEDMHPSMDPKKYKDEKLFSQEANPIVFALDVTGSMGEWSRIVYDKLPMFYGQILLQKYLKEPSMSFCAVGDIKTDSCPLQVSSFSQGGGIDESICNLYLEGNGGGNNHESYDIAAYFYSEKVDLQNVEMPFFFLTCDELFWEDCTRMQFNKVFGNSLAPGQQKFDTMPYWKMLLEKYNVFILRKELTNKVLEPNVHKKWCDTLGTERILKISNPKAVIDAILGAISLTSGARNLEEYKKDLIDRGQTEERINEVISLLEPYYNSIINGQAKIIKNHNYKPIENEKGDSKFSEIREYFINKINQENSYDSSYFKDLIKLSEELEGKIPEEIICPITKTIFCTPVKTSKGKVYEKIAIEKWLETEKVDPLINEALSYNNLSIDNITKEKVFEFYECSKIYLEL